MADHDDSNERETWELAPELQSISGEAWQLGRRAWEESQAHYEQSKIDARRHSILTWSSILLASASGVTALADLPSWIVAVIAFAAAVAGGADAAFVPGEKAERHRQLGVEFASIRHATHDFCKVRLRRLSREVAEESLRDFRDRWKDASARATPLPSDTARTQAAVLLEKDLNDGGLAWDIGPPVGAYYIEGPSHDDAPSSTDDE